MPKFKCDILSNFQTMCLGINGLPSVLLMSGLIWYQTKKMAKARKLAKIPATTKALVRFEAQKQNRVVCVFIVKIQLIPDSPSPFYL